MNKSTPPETRFSRLNNNQISLSSDENFMVSEDYVQKSHYDKKIMIIGEAGSGKSSLLNMIINLSKQKKLKELVKPAINEMNVKDKISGKIKTITKEVQYFEIEYSGFKFLLIDTPGFEANLIESSDNRNIEAILKVATILSTLSIFLVIKSDQIYLNSSISKNIKDLLRSFDQFEIKYDIYLVFTFYAGNLEFEINSLQLMNLKKKEIKINNKFFNINRTKLERGNFDADYENILKSIKKLLDNFYEPATEQKFRIKIMSIGENPVIKRLIKNHKIEIVEHKNLLCINCETICQSKIQVNSSGCFPETFQNNCKCGHNEETHYITDIKIKKKNDIKHEEINKGQKYSENSMHIINSNALELEKNLKNTIKNNTNELNNLKNPIKGIIEASPNLKDKMIESRKDDKSNYHKSKIDNQMKNNTLNQNKKIEPINKMIVTKKIKPSTPQKPKKK